MLRKHKVEQDVFPYFIFFVLECHANSVLKLMNGTFQVFCVKQVDLTGVCMLMSINQRFACVRQACISFNKHGCKMHYYVISGARDLTKCVLRRSG